MTCSALSSSCSMASTPPSCSLLLVGFSGWVPHVYSTFADGSAQVRARFLSLSWRSSWSALLRESAIASSQEIQRALSGVITPGDAGSTVGNANRGDHRLVAGVE